MHNILSLVVRISKIHFRMRKMFYENDNTMRIQKPNRIQKKNENITKKVEKSRQR